MAVSYPPQNVNCEDYIPMDVPEEHIFSSLKGAMDYLRDNCIVIPEGKKVIIEVITNQGIDEPISLKHPYGERITIHGNSETNPGIYTESNITIEYDRYVNGNVIESSVGISGLNTDVYLENGNINFEDINLQRQYIATQPNIVPNAQILRDYIESSHRDFLPPKIFNHMAVVVNNDMYVLGGVTDTPSSSYVYSSGVYKYDFVNRRWSRLITTGSYPEVSGGSIIHYNGYLYLWGGTAAAGTGHNNDIWRYHIATATWFRIAAPSTAPVLKNSHSAVVNGTTMIVFGGNITGNEVWTYDLSGTNTWTKRTDAPFYSYGHSAVVYNNLMFVYGGTLSNGSPNTILYELNLTNYTTWTNRGTHSYNSRRYHSAGVDNGFMYIYGGQIHSSGSWQSVPSNQYFSVRLTSPYTVSGATVVPAGEKSNHTGVMYTTNQGRMFVFGGIYGAYDYSSKNNNFFSITTGGTKVDLGYVHPMVGSYNNKLYIYRAGTNEAVMFDLGTYITTYSVTNLMFADGGCVFNYNDNIYYLQGLNFRRRTNDTTWANLPNPPRSIVNGTALIYGSRLYVFGGSDFSRDINVFNFSSSTWSTIAPAANTPVGRHSHAAAIHNNRMYIHGGLSISNTVLNDLSYYDFNTLTWTTINQSSTQGRYRHVMQSIDGILCIFGGMLDTAITTVVNFIYYLDSTNNEWVNSSPTLPNNVADHGYVYVSSSLYIVGGISRANQSTPSIIRVYIYPEILKIGSSYVGPTNYMRKTIKGFSPFVIKNNSNVNISNCFGGSYGSQHVLCVSVPNSSPTGIKYIAYEIESGDILIENNSGLTYDGEQTNLTLFAKTHSTIHFKVDVPYTSQLRLTNRSVFKGITGENPLSCILENSYFFND